MQCAETLPLGMFAEWQNSFGCTHAHGPSLLRRVWCDVVRLRHYHRSPRCQWRIRFCYKRKTCPSYMAWSILKNVQQYVSWIFDRWRLRSVLHGGVVRNPHTVADCTEEASTSDLMSEWGILNVKQHWVWLFVPALSCPGICMQTVGLYSE